MSELTDERPRCSHGVVFPYDNCAVCLREEVRRLREWIIEADSAFNRDGERSTIDECACLVRMCHEGRAAMDEVQRLRAALDDANLSEGVCEVEMDRAIHDRNNLAIKLERAKDTIRLLRMQLNASNQQAKTADAWHADWVRSEERLAATRDQYDRLRGEYDSLKGDYAMATKERDELQVELDGETNAGKALLREAFADLQKQIAALKERNAALYRTIDEDRQLHMLAGKRLQQLEKRIRRYVKEYESEAYG